MGGLLSELSPLVDMAGTFPTLKPFPSTDNNLDKSFLSSPAFLPCQLTLTLGELARKKNAQWFVADHYKAGQRKGHNTKRQ